MCQNQTIYIEHLNHVLLSFRLSLGRYFLNIAHFFIPNETCIKISSELLQILEQQYHLFDI